jgi:hypothetical protein
MAIMENGKIFPSRTATYKFTVLGEWFDGDNVLVELL